MMRAIIVDDEPPARREMRRLLGGHSDVTVVGEAASLVTARGLLLRGSPDIVFLDIRLGRENGFDLLADIDRDTYVIFVTAYDSYAIKAFEANALDYLVKPVEEARLGATLERARGAQPDATVRAKEPSFSAGSWIYLDAGEIPAFVRIPTISYIAARDGGSVIHTADGKSFASARPLTAWEGRLSGGNFVRIHRATLINLEHVEKVERWFQYSYRVFVHGASTPLQMSRRYASNIRELLG